jgi:hypothetical protein
VEELAMSMFWKNFESNGRVRSAAVGELRESLGEVCESFALLADLPRWQRRQSLLAELQRLADFYRRSETWDALG